MLHFQVNKQVPEEFLVELNKSSGERSFCTIINNALSAFVILQGITKDELKSVAEEVHVIYQEFDIPFLILKYKGMSFDMPLFVHKDDSDEEIGNALTVYFIELSGYVVKHMRLLGLNDDVMRCIRRGIESIKRDGLSRSDIFLKAQKVYSQKTPEEMLRGGVRHIFPGTF